MADAPESKRGCFKVGCCGCLAVLLLLILGSSACVGAGLLLEKDPEVVRADGSHDLPRAYLGSDAGEAASGDLDPAQLDRVGGTVTLDVRYTELKIVPAESGEPLRVSGDYDEAGFRLKETFEESADGWDYRLEFNRKRSWLPFFSTDGNRNHLELHIPRDVAFRLQGEAGVGSYRMDLGGLAVRAVDLDLGVGEHHIDFSEPLPVPLESLRLDSSIGELKVRRVGNGSPAEVWIERGIGEARVDLSGAWQGDAEIDIRCGIGECVVTFPDDVNVDVRTSATIGEAIGPRGNREVIEGAPWLRGRVSGGIGSVQAR